MVGANFWADMRGHGVILIDFPARKVAGYDAHCVIEKARGDFA